jgi:hypothetical protein
LPRGYVALADQQASGPIPDVLTLNRRLKTTGKREPGGLPELSAPRDARPPGPALNQPDRWSSRRMYRLLPLLFRTGLLQWLQRKERRLMSEGVVPVRLVV